MNILVQKFGGTSLKNSEARKYAIQHIIASKREGYKIVVVVSAMGRAPDPYATDSLLSLINFPNGHQSNQEQDLLMACGEIISAVVLSNELKHIGLSATALTGAQAGLITTGSFTSAKIKMIKTDRIKQELATHDVVVVAGFQGETVNHETTTLGRGGSDTTAAALGAALEAEYIDIFTDVNGVMTADPKVVKDAQRLKVISYTDVCHLAYQGTKVIHPRAVEIAMQSHIPIRVRSNHTDVIGTLITGMANNEKGVIYPDRLITGIAHMADITQIKIESDEPSGLLHAQIFETMAEASISVDFINIFPSGVIYTIPQLLSKRAEKLLRNLGYDPLLTHNCAKVSIVGAGMTGVPGITAKMVHSLVSEGIEILQSADSHTTIWALIKEEDLVKAINALHQAFELNNRLKTV